MIFAAEQQPVLFPPLGEIIIGLISFALLVFLLGRFVYPRFEATYQARRDAIEGGIERAEKAQAEAQQALTQYKAQLAEARTEAAQIRESARAEGQRIIEEMRVQAQTESARITARGEEQLASSRQQIVQELRRDLGSLAVTLAGRVVGESLEEPARRSGTVDRFLDDLDEMSAREPGAPGVSRDPVSDGAH